MKKILFLALTLLFFYSCKEDVKEMPQNEVNEEKTELIVDFNFKTSKEDMFKIILNNIKVDELQKKHITIVEKVSPSSDFENITAIFNEGNVSKNVYINLGGKFEKEIEIDNINISYGIKTLNINSDSLKEYFVLNKFIEIKEDGLLLVKKVDNKLNPQLKLKGKYISQLYK